MKDNSFNGYSNSATYGAALYLENDYEACRKIESLWRAGKLDVKAIQTVFKDRKMEIDPWAEGPVGWEEIANDFSASFKEQLDFEPPAAIDTLAIISSAIIDGNTVKLTCGQLERSDYENVAAILNALGGKWNKKANGFLFQTDPSEQIEDVLLTGKIKKPEKYGFFPTPPGLAEEVVEIADLRPGLSVLEPEAGTGNLADLAAEVVGKENVVCCELQAHNAQLLTDKGYRVTMSDFLNVPPAPIFDRVIMNPPFERQQDISHVLHAWEFLKPGGRLVSIMSSSVTFRSDKKSAQFRLFLDEYGTLSANPEGSFKPSGTNVNTITVVLTKSVELTAPKEVTTDISSLFKDNMVPLPAPIPPPPVAHRSGQLLLF